MNLTKEQIANRKIWVENLRFNKKYVQGKNMLRVFEHDAQSGEPKPVAFCCLGVAQDVFAPEEWPFVENKSSRPSLSVINDLGLTDEELRTFAYINDSSLRHQGFSKVIKAIENIE